MGVLEVMSKKRICSNVLKNRTLAGVALLSIQTVMPPNFNKPSLFAGLKG